MKTYEIISSNPEDTLEIARRLGKILKPADVLLLEGDLGAGKTTFTKGLASGLGIKRNVNSPTFTIIKEYHGRIPLYHMDVYRLEDSFEDLGFDEYFYGDGVTVVEWAQFIEDQLPQSHLSLYIYHENQNQRRIVFQPTGTRYEALCEELFDENPGN
ncbi:tRNA (adenosine(37)-N6)-threonylcarbamoyltransferase complex ATPase subunit type 1 TsaE [Siminovitchia terrae]|uniref:tRNA threonylcarbamoyladenosine biosynthesis protein TsaE n=1 Tax=Siminovitchia terrae TaxID=1914933 RepID=A0A429X2P1_SIMTE|nr:tRNA (adenosine(37)-N6)-threonylcarbamoyltransferase complex ATPase subunit type 1 TsaE [Siminovitchia terrae]RST57605.1 tRNA (adenosine(37)-N6)-threonylcarbamoyltransferase complex ATPase subunit type 1 TsaE [Siminovitchia terrae]GIN93408.1 tRNA (adenosine(37)-N6)-threonylcarbamoyltransferase complex ATPase subunit type 1 TsaE [Siminovitchia terrae]